MDKVIACSPIYTLKLFTVSTVVIKGVCLMGNAVITGNGGAADADVFDGENNHAEKKLHLEALTGVTFSTGAGQSHKMNKGIYVQINNGTTELMLTFRHLHKHEIENNEE